MVQTLQTSARKPGQSQPGQSQPGQIVRSWREQRSSIDTIVRETRRWIVSMSPETSDPERELAAMMAEFAGSLRSHFDCGCELYDSLAEQLWCVEVELAKRTAQADHCHLLASLIGLTAKLQDAGSPDEGFKGAVAGFLSSVEELEWFFDQLDQHEEREADSFEWLLQANCD